MLVLFETAAGYAVFKVLKPGKLKNTDKLAENFSTVEKSKEFVNLLAFSTFKDSAEALKASLAINDGKMDKKLSKTIKKAISKEMTDKLMVLDSKLGQSIKEKFSDLDIVSNTSVTELVRNIRSQMTGLLCDVSDKEHTAMRLGLGHNVSRYKLKFSPDKVDTMVVQSISLMDELDKELNNYIMRAKEWYGWHFPELSKIVEDNAIYIDFILKVGKRENAKFSDLTSFMSEELSDRVTEAAEVSMGTEIADFDMDHIQQLCDMIKGYTDYRQELLVYITNRMQNLAPNVSALVGEVIGARLLAHAGSLTNLAKYPSSTVQLIGAEKALFNALKKKKSTPKYGLLFHAELVNKCKNPSEKGKMSRMLANKTSLGARLDALYEEEKVPFKYSVNNKAYLSRKLESWHGGKVTLKSLDRGFHHRKQLQGHNRDVFTDEASGAVPSVKKEEAENEAPQENGEEKKKKKKKRKERENDEEVEEEKPKKKKAKKE